MTITTWDPRDAAGPELIGILLNWGLFGILSLQVYTYSQFFPKDKFLLKTLVGVLYILEMTQTFLMTQTAWGLFTSKSESAERFDEIGTVGVSIWVLGPLRLIVQFFYAYRIWLFSRNKVIPGLIALISCTSFGVGLHSAALQAQAKTISRLFEAQAHGKFPVVAFWATSCVLCDGLIAGCMCYYLRRRSPSRGFSKTHALISKLLRMTIETGLLTASMSTLTALLYYPDKLKRYLYFAVPLSVHAKCYSTTMLAGLNSRLNLRVVAGLDTEKQGENVLVSVTHSGLDADDIGTLSSNSPEGR